MNDEAVQKVELGLFQCQPSQDWRKTLPDDDSGPSSYAIFLDYLQFCYLCMFVVVLLVPAWLYCTRSEKERNSFVPTTETLQEVLVDLDDDWKSVDSRRSRSESYGTYSKQLAHQHSLVGDVYGNDDDHIAFDQALVCLLLVSYASWVFSMFYPVAGPMWCLQK